MLKTSHYNPPLKMIEMSDEELEEFHKTYLELLQNYAVKVSVFPEHLAVHKFGMTLELHICPWCKQPIYIGEQIKDIVALACPNCGGPLHTGE